MPGKKCYAKMFHAKLLFMLLELSINCLTIGWLTCWYGCSLSYVCKLRSLLTVKM